MIKFKKNNLQQIIAKVFLVFLSFRMIAPLLPLTGPAGTFAESFSSIFHLIGVAFLVVSHKKLFDDKEANSIIKYFLMLAIIFSCMTFIMAFYIDNQYGDYNGQSPFKAFFKTTIVFIQYTLILIYSKAVFQYLNKDEIVKCLIWSTRLSLFIGYLQFAELRHIPGLSSLYYIVADFLNLRTLPYQISLTFYEPSWAAMFVGIVVIPLHMARLIYGEFKNKKIIFELLLWIPIVVMTKSSTAYLVTFMSLGTATVYMMFKRSKNNALKVFSVLFLILGSVLFNNIDYVDEILGFDFSYLLINKITDIENNQSTSTRTIMLFLNWEVFKKFPLFGCGNGLQGYFFRELTMPQAYRGVIVSEDTMNLIYGTSEVIPNGQSFFLGILSGYGFLGVLLFVKFLFSSLKIVLKNMGDYGLWGLMYIFGFFPMIFSGMKSEFIGIIYIWFVLSIPYAAKTGKIEET